MRWVYFLLAVSLAWNVISAIQIGKIFSIQSQFLQLFAIVKRWCEENSDAIIKLAGREVSDDDGK